jgi:hypothetical protein
VPEDSSSGCRRPDRRKILWRSAAPKPTPSSEPKQFASRLSRRRRIGQIRPRDVSCTRARSDSGGRWGARAGERRTPGLRRPSLQLRPPQQPLNRVGRCDCPSCPSQGEVVGKEGLEPSPLAGLEPKSSASTNFATRPRGGSRLPPGSYAGSRRASRPEAWRVPAIGMERLRNPFGDGGRSGFAVLSGFGSGGPLDRWPRKIAGGRDDGCSEPPEEARRGPSGSLRAAAPSRWRRRLGLTGGAARCRGGRRCRPRSPLRSAWRPPEDRPRRAPD